MSDIPRCPNCEIGCSLDAIQCSRGFGIAARYSAGEDVEAAQAEAHEATRGPVGTGGGFRGSAAAYLASGPRV